MRTVVLLTLILLNSGCAKPDGPSSDSRELVEVSSDWFRVSSLNSNTFIIEEPKSSQGNVSYLLVGDERAVLFDTGRGENEAVDGFKIRKVIEELTNTPVTLLLSHFHFDHVQNISEFEVIAFPDLPMLRERVSADGVFALTEEELFVGGDPIKVTVGEWFPVDRTIDLGNRKIRLVNIPGHTSESIAIIDETNKEAFLGDFLYNGSLFLFRNDDLSLYENSGEFLLSSLGPEYRLFGAHGDPEIEFESLRQLLNLLAGIRDGSYPPKEGIVWDLPVLRYESATMAIIIFQEEK
jgi:glyoxylase-like metal-dependent hydrolase (beta-lactamase superfamily II)